MQIEDVDARDERAFAGWFAVVEAVERETRTDERGPSAQERREQALQGRPGDDGAPPEEELVELLVVRDGGQVVGAALAELPHQQRAVWLLRELEEMSYDDIATTLAMTPDSVRGQLHRGRRNLAERMAQWR